MKHVISLGAGVQSSTLALMAANGEIKPMPEVAIFADTGWERAATYQWLDELERLLPFPVLRVSTGNIREQNIKARNGEKTNSSKRWGSIPFFVSDTKGTGREGMIRRQCTKEYKLQPLRRKIAQLCGLPEKVGRPRQAVAAQWIGISTDEASRMRHSNVGWLQLRYPLAMEKRFSRADCEAWLKRNGYPVPERSACIGCPYHSDQEWLTLKNDSPAEWRKAVQFDRSVRHGHGMKGASYLHRSLIPLEQITFKNEKQTDLFKNECEGLCGL